VNKDLYIKGSWELDVCCASFDERQLAAAAAATAAAAAARRTCGQLGSDFSQIPLTTAGRRPVLSR